MVAHMFFGRAKYIVPDDARMVFRLKWEDVSPTNVLWRNRTESKGVIAIRLCIARHGSVTAMLDTRPRMNVHDHVAFFSLDARESYFSFAS